MYFIYDDYSYLAHHGILGMHWGVRRYQNDDGTLTEAGKRRVKKASSYENRLNRLDKSAVKEISRYNSADRKINKIEKKIKKVGSNNLSLKQTEQYPKLKESREKHYRNIGKIDSKIMKQIKTITRKGYDVSVNDVMRKYPGVCEIGKQYVVTESDNRRGSIMGTSMSEVRHSLNR